MWVGPRRYLQAGLQVLPASVVDDDEAEDEQSDEDGAGSSRRHDGVQQEADGSALQEDRSPVCSRAWTCGMQEPHQVQ